MSYGLRTRRGVSGLGVMRYRGYGFRGFGDVAAPGSQLVPLPNYANCDPRDTACVNNNEALNTAYNLQVQQAQAANNAQQCLDNANNATSPEQKAAALASCGAQYTTQGGTPAGAPAIFSTGGGPVTPASFSFTTSRGGTSLQVGDTWTVTITGAQPSASVWVNGSMPSGPFTNSVQGQTDSSGNFSKSGVADASTVGNWSERWNVGNNSVGFVQFTVTPASVASPAGAPAAKPGISLPAANVPAPVSTGFDFSSIPWWGWAAGAGVAVLAFSGGGRR